MTNVETMLTLKDIKRQLDISFIYEIVLRINMPIIKKGFQVKVTQGKNKGKSEFFSTEKAAKAFARKNAYTKGHGSGCTCLMCKKAKAKYY